jgi:hypothetical protein
MKKSIKIITAICMFSITVANAQKTNVRNKLMLGVKAGVNISNVWDAQGDQFTADAKVGFAGGAFLGIPLGKYIGFQPEILVTQNGFKGSGNLLGSPYSNSRTTSYLVIPLQIQIKPVNFLTIVAGPQFSYLFNQKDVYTFGGNSALQEQEFKNENIRKNVFGFVGGADFIYKSFVFSGRVGWDIQNNNGDGTSTTPRYKNKWLQFTLGFKL